jgi:hypothetical protein
LPSRLKLLCRLGLQLPLPLGERIEVRVIPGCAFLYSRADNARGFLNTL